jgi:hypothetical protein
MKEQTSINLNSIQKSGLFFTLFVFTCCLNMIAQPGINIYTELGRNNISQSLYIKSAALGNYNFGNKILSTGILIDLNKNNKISASGYTINASRYITLQRMVLELQGFFTMTELSEIIQETNWGILLNVRRNHFEIAIGSNFRTYSFSGQAQRVYKIMNDAVSINEAFNIIYSFRCKDFL